MQSGKSLGSGSRLRRVRNDGNLVVNARLAAQRFVPRRQQNSRHSGRRKAAIRNPVTLVLEEPEAAAITRRPTEGQQNSRHSGRREAAIRNPVTLRLEEPNDAAAVTRRPTEGQQNS